MKKLLIFCGLLFGVITFANAQQGGGRMGGTPEERVKRQVDQLTERLKLSDEQKTKATEVFKAQVDAQSKMREEMQGGGGDRQAMMEKMQKLNSETETKINAFLTDDQKKEYKTMVEERQKAMRERQGGGGGRGGQ